MKKLLISAIVATAMLCSCNEKKVELSGAGATFPLPYYNIAFNNFNEANNITVSYGGIGSGGGIRSLKDKIVDFAGSDAFISDNEMAEMEDVIHVPTCMGAVVLSYNLKEISNLNLTGEIIADIYAGNITKWNDTRIAEINSGISLPDKVIAPVFRSDGSGTTFVFSDYLSKASADWQTHFGAGKTIDFPVGIAAKGNPGVAGIVAQTDGSIGYIGSEYAFSTKSKIANIQNPNGEFVTPTSQSISAAAQGDIASDTRCMITNSTAQGAYPISCFTWLITYREQSYSDRSIEQAQATKLLLQYMLSDDAQAFTEKVHYAPLSSEVKAMAQKAINDLTYNGKNL